VIIWTKDESAGGNWTSEVCTFCVPSLCLDSYCSWCLDRKTDLNCLFVWLQVLSTFNDVVWHASWSITGDILAISGGDNKVFVTARYRN